jgi:Spy/CpxP family protein refolding chaperone
VKKRFIYNQTIFVAALLLLSPLFAQSAPDKGEHFCDKKQEEKCDKKGSRELCEKKGHKGKKHGKRYDILNYTDQLGLSDAQVKVIRQMKLEFKKEKIKTEAEIEVLEIELKDIYRDSSASMKDISKKVREIEKKKGDVRIAKFKLKRDIRSRLNPEQLQKMLELYSGFKPGKE